MKNIDIIAAFELEINKIDDLLNKPVTDDSLYWINQAIVKFVKLRFNRDFVHGTSYEQTSKRTEDLIRLYKNVTISLKDYTAPDVGDATLKPGIKSIENSIENNERLDGPIIGGDILDKDDEDLVFVGAKYYKTQEVTYPKDFMYPLSQSVQIKSKKNASEIHDTSVFECTNDNFMYRITNSLTDFHYRNKKARPLMVRTDKGCILYNDKNYEGVKYILSYLRKPSTLSMENPHEEYTDFPDHILYEIIKMAAQMYVENKSENRYNTISNEVNTQE